KIKEPEPPQKGDPVTPVPVPVPPKPGVDKPDAPPTPKDPRLALLLEHVPTAAELDLLEELLAVSRSTLASRRGYAFDAAAEKILEFRRLRSLPPWVELFAET